jgi:hypothetical protein
MNYTQGEWRACCLEGYPHFVFAGEGAKCVCALMSNDPDDKDNEYEHLEEIVTLEERQGNAALIQASPDMYEAIRDLMNVPGIVDCMPVNIWDELEKAKKKAEGENE